MIKLLGKTLRENNKRKLCELLSHKHTPSRRLNWRLTIPDGQEWDGKRQPLGKTVEQFVKVKCVSVTHPANPRPPPPHRLQQDAPSKPGRDSMKEIGQVS